MCEIEVESRWMLRNIPEMVGAFRKETLTHSLIHSNIKYLCCWGAVGIAWAKFQLVHSIKKWEGSITSFELTGHD